MPTTTVKAIHIHATTRQALEEQLETAVKDLREVAILTGTYGILVTRHTPGSYTAELSEKVPFGITQELIY